MKKTYLRRHRETHLAYRDRAKARLKELAAKGRAQLQGFKCPHCGFNYGPFAIRPAGPFHAL